MPCRFYSFWVTWRGLQCLFRKLKIDVGIGGYKIELYKCIIFFNSILLSIYCFLLLFLSMYCYFECILYCVNFVGPEFKWYNKNSPISIR
jgi:hypothetical protein